MNTKIFKRCNLGRGPAVWLSPVDGEHVVSEDLSECQLVYWRLGLHLRQPRLAHLQAGTVQLWRTGSRLTSKIWKCIFVKQTYFNEIIRESFQKFHNKIYHSQSFNVERVRLSLSKKVTYLINPRIYLDIIPWTSKRTTLVLLFAFWARLACVLKMSRNLLARPEVAIFPVPSCNLFWLSQSSLN